MFKDLLDKINDFKYQIAVTVLLSKHKENGDIEFAPVCFNSTTKTVINCKYDIDKSFQEVLYRIDNWTNEGSGWLIEYMDGEYIDISIYSPLSGSSYIELHDKLRNSMKGLINIKNNVNMYFILYHNRHLNTLKTHTERKKKPIKICLMILIMKEMNFLSLKKIIV